jgi:hypothetical protein
MCFAVRRPDSLFEVVNHVKMVDFLRIVGLVLILIFSNECLQIKSAAIKVCIQEAGPRVRFFYI